MTRPLMRMTIPRLRRTARHHGMTLAECVLSRLMNTAKERRQYIDAGAERCLYVEHLGRRIEEYLSLGRRYGIQESTMRAMLEPDEVAS